MRITTSCQCSFLGTLLAVTSPAAAGPASGGEPVAEAPEAASPDAKWLAGLLARERLLGDPGGARSWLEDRGVTLALVYTAEGFWNTRGGISTDDANAYRGDLSLFAEVDTELAGLWRDGTLFLHVQEQHGSGITNKYVGDFQVLSNIDADYVFQVSELWYRHELFEESLWIKLGKQEANEDFAYVENGGEFINSSPGFSPTIPLVTFPDQDWGLVVGLEAVEWFSMNVGVYQGRSNGSQSVGNTLDKLYGPLVMAEPALHYSLMQRSGHLRAGGWFNGDRFDALDDGNVEPGGYRESYGFYVTWDQELLWENPGDAEDEQGVYIFGQYGWAPEDRSEAEHYIGAGLQWLGPVPYRDDDMLGFGVFHVAFSDEAGFEESHETVIELFYRAEVSGWLSLKPDLQYIINPGGTRSRDALALGVRAEIAF
jgi:porin